MTLKDFIRENKAEIDSTINRALNYVPREASCSCLKSGTNHEHANARRLDYSERRQWILNDEGLYSWARSSGVCI